MFYHCIIMDLESVNKHLLYIINHHRKFLTTPENFSPSPEKLSTPHENFSTPLEEKISTSPYIPFHFVLSTLFPLLFKKI